jgi:hypothetical protein
MRINFGEKVLAWRHRPLRAAFLLGCALLLSGGALGSSIGDSYQKVIADKGQPAGKMEAGDILILRYSDCAIKLKDGVVVSIKVAQAAAPAQAGPGPTQAPKTGRELIVTIQRDERRAVQRVIDIVNQPLEQFPITRGMSVAYFPTWFHPGAETPDFTNVDVTQFEDDKNYEVPSYEYCTSPLCQGIAFRLSDVGFNSKTKMFYVDRSLPKKRLTIEEMKEINTQYRTIARCYNALVALGVTPTIEIK